MKPPLYLPCPGPHCNKVSVPIEAAQLRICNDALFRTFVYRCPDCMLRIAEPIDKGSLALYQHMGVAVVYWDLPEEMFEPHRLDPISTGEEQAYSALFAGPSEVWFADLYRRYAEELDLPGE